MTAKQKAVQLVEELSYDITAHGRRHGKQCAFIVVREVYKGLYNYLKNTDELQNVDREFAYWDEVTKEIENL